MRKKKTNTPGLLITVIFHLTVIVVLLVQQMQINKQREQSFVIDFTQQEEMERMEKEMKELEEEIKRMENMREEVLKNLEKKMADNTPSSKDVKNLAVNKGQPLKDDRNTDAEKLYKDAAKLEADLKKGHKSAIGEEALSETVDMSDQSKGDSDAKEYSGPSVLSYRLDGRTATYLPIPAYHCRGGGQITVTIKVNRQGMVVNAQINENVSESSARSDKCIREYALRAARQSRFSKSSTAPEQQIGEIVYQFIAQ